MKKWERKNEGTKERMERGRKEGKGDSNKRMNCDVFHHSCRPSTNNIWYCIIPRIRCNSKANVITLLFPKHEPKISYFLFKNTPLTVSNKNLNHEQIRLYPRKHRLCRWNKMILVFTELVADLPFLVVGGWRVGPVVLLPPTQVWSPSSGNISQLKLSCHEKPYCLKIGSQPYLALLQTERQGGTGVFNAVQIGAYMEQRKNCK